MKNKLNTLSLATLAIALSLAGCSSTPVDENEATTSIDNTEVSTAVSAAPVEQKPLALESMAETVFYFDFDKATLRSESRAALMQHAESLQNSLRNVRLEGHADELGTREYNMALLGHPQTNPPAFSRNGVCLVGKSFPDPAGYFAEGPKCHIRHKYEFL